MCAISSYHELLPHVLVLSLERNFQADSQLPGDDPYRYGIEAFIRMQKDSYKVGNLIRTNASTPDVLQYFCSQLLNFGDLDNCSISQPNQYFTKAFVA